MIVHTDKLDRFYATLLSVAQLREVRPTTSEQS